MSTISEQQLKLESDGEYFQNQKLDQAKWEIKSVQHKIIQPQFYLNLLNKKSLLQKLKQLGSFESEEQNAFKQQDPASQSRAQNQNILFNSDWNPINYPRSLLNTLMQNPIFSLLWVTWNVDLLVFRSMKLRAYRFVNPMQLFLLIQLNRIERKQDAEHLERMADFALAMRQSKVMMASVNGEEKERLQLAMSKLHNEDLPNVGQQEMVEIIKSLKI